MRDIIVQLFRNSDGVNGWWDVSSMQMVDGTEQNLAARGKYWKFSNGEIVEGGKISENILLMYSPIRSLVGQSFFPLERQLNVH